MAKKKKTPSRNSGRDALLGTFASNRSDLGSTIATLKTQRNYKRAKNIIESIQRLHLDRGIYLSSVASVWNNIVFRPLYPKSSDWVEEFGWLGHSFRAESVKIDSFTKQEKVFWTHFLLGAYDQASESLKLIEENHGLSVWLAEKEFMLLQHKEGFESHKRKLSKVQTSISYTMASLVVTTLSNKAEPYVTYDGYTFIVQRTVNDLRKNKLDTLASFFEIQVQPWSEKWASNAHDMLHWCIGQPLVDRYHKALKITSSLISENVAEGSMERLRYIVNDLKPCAPDLSFARLAFLIEASAEFERSSLSEAYYNAYDILISGDYRKAATIAEELVRANSTCFDFYSILAMAKACEPESNKLGFETESITSKILHNMQQLAENGDGVNYALNELKNLSLKLGDSYLGICLWQLVQQEDLGVVEKDPFCHAFIQCEIDSLEMLSNLEPERQSSCLIKLQKTYGEHICFAAFFYDSMESDILDSCTSQMSKSFAAIIKARRAHHDGLHEDVLIKLEPLKNISECSEKESRVHMREAASLQFIALMQLERVEEAATSILNYYIENPNNLRHVPFEQLVESVMTGKWAYLKGKPLWPILVYLNNGEIQDVYEAVDDLVTMHNFDSPLSIADGRLICPEAELRILLKDILVPSVIARGALWFENAADRRMLRITFLQKLFAISVEDQAMVLEEISEIEQAKLLEEAYRNIEGPKFYLDFGEINKALMLLLATNFERYLEYQDYEYKGGKLATDADLLELTKAEATEKVVTERRSETSELLIKSGSDKLTVASHKVKAEVG